MDFSLMSKLNGRTQSGYFFLAVSRKVPQQPADGLGFLSVTTWFPSNVMVAVII